MAAAKLVRKPGSQKSKRADLFPGCLESDCRRVLVLFHKPVKKQLPQSPNYKDDDTHEQKGGAEI